MPPKPLFLDDLIPPEIRPEIPFDVALDDPDARLPALVPQRVMAGLERPLVPGLDTVPAPRTRFFGRDRELSETSRLVAANQCVTLTGPGGVGKTRLAVELARRTLPSGGSGFDEVVWVSLVALSDPGLLHQTVAAALRVPEEPGRELLAPLFERIRAGHLLLVLDNCEHLLDAVARLVETLFAAGGRLRVLATSRQPLGVPGEVGYPVPLLEVPKESLPAADLHSVPAVDLLLDRAGAVQPGFAVTSANAAALVALCRRLDGVPLAIELAAARLRMLTLEQINTRLDASVRLLSTRGPGPERHRSLQATMDWSYGLLSLAERAFFARLSVFAGGFDLDAAEEVVGGGDQDETLELLSGLVDKSLVLVTERGRQMRYRLLETVRSYAEDKLSTVERDAVQGTHVAHFVALAERAEPELCGSESRQWLDVLDVERANLRSALYSSAAGREPHAGLRLASACWRFCYLRGHYAQGRSWLGHALSAAVDPPDGLRAKALTAAGTLAHLECKYRDAAADLASALRIYRGLGDRAGEAAALQSLGSVARERGLYSASRRLHEDSLALFRGLGDDACIARSLNYLGFLAWLQGDFDRAMTLCRQALAIVERTADRESLAWALLNLGAIEYYRGEPDKADALLYRSLQMSQDLGHREGIAWCANLLGLLGRARGDLAAAQRWLLQSLEVHRALGDRWRSASVLTEMAALAEATGQPERAVRLLAAAQAMREEIGAPVPPVERAAADAAVAARGCFDAGALAGAEHAGRTQSLDRLLGDVGRDGERAEVPRLPPLAVSAPRLGALDISALGTTRVHLDGHPLGPADWGYAKPKELLYYLLDFPDRTKEQVGAELWPWASTGSLRNSFHATVYALRRALGRADRIVYRGGRYAFNRSLAYSYDLERLEAALAAATDATGESVVPALLAAVTAYGGDFLPDVEGEAWIELRRSDLRRQHSSALLTCGRLQVAGSDLTGAIDTYQRAITFDPMLETAHRELVRCYAKVGERGLAVRHGRTLIGLLREELGVPPGPETAELLARLRRGEPI